PRCGHSLVALSISEENAESDSPEPKQTIDFLILSGGRDSIGITNDIFLFDVESETWLECTTKLPSPLVFHSANVANGGKRIFFIGGDNSVTSSSNGDESEAQRLNH